MATKKVFRTLLDAPVEIVTKSGEELEDVIALRINEEGKEEFYIAGQTNVYEKIQAEAENSTIENILAKVIATGDTSILQKVKGEYMDLTVMPKTMFEAQQRLTEAEKAFEQLPLEVRNEYNNNFNEYLKDVGTDHWLETVGLKEKKIPIPEEPAEKGEAE